MDTKAISDAYKVVHDKYSSIARSTSKNDTTHAKIAEAFGYSAEELQSVSSGNLGLGCGAPVAQAKLKQGEVVLDLGSGGGLDVFLAAKTAGKAIGVDMSHDMIALARRNAAKLNLPDEKFEFVYSKLPDVELPDNSVDCVISNCVINLIPHAEKGKVFEEMFRVLKPGGRVVVSDVLARKPLPEDIRGDVALYVGCVAGASQIAEYEDWLRDASFQDIAIVDSKHDLNTFRDNECCAPSSPAKKSDEKCCDSDCCKIRDQTDKSASDQTCCGKDITKGCCGNNEQEIELEVPEGPFSCCSPQQNKDRAQRPSVKDSIIEDLNEWVGSFMVFSVKPTI